MVAGHNVEQDGKTWKLTLRDGLLFHDGQPVLARDCVASIRRWAVRDVLGQVLIQLTDELSAPDDKTILFRLKRPFPLLPDTLGKAGSNMCAMMPERLANTDSFKQVTEMTGSGPYDSEKPSGFRGRSSSMSVSRATSQVKVPTNRNGLPVQNSPISNGSSGT